MYEEQLISWFSGVYSHKLLESSVTWQEMLIDVSFIFVSRVNVCVVKLHCPKFPFVLWVWHLWKSFPLPVNDVIWDHMNQVGGLDVKLTHLPTTNILIIIVGRSVNSFSVTDCTIQYSTVLTESRFISGLLTTFVTLQTLDIEHHLTVFFFQIMS